MEPSGRNRWQPVANGTPPKTAQIGRSATGDGKEGVDGSSPSEGSAKAPHVGAFVFTSTCRFSRVRWVWSRLWSFRVGEGLGRARPMPSEVAAPTPGTRYGCATVTPRNPPRTAVQTVRAMTERAGVRPSASPHLETLTSPLVASEIGARRCSVRGDDLRCLRGLRRVRWHCSPRDHREPACAPGDAPALRRLVRSARRSSRLREGLRPQR
jgi:hypothetical protein